MLLEFLPVAAFFGTYLYLKDIYTATMVLMVAMVLSALVFYLRTRKVPTMFGISTLLVLAFGAATLLLRNPKFIQWKPTILLWGMALAFLVSTWIGKALLAQRMLQPALGEHQLARSDWLKLNWAWVLFGLLTGLANILIAYNAPEATWVKVKSIGLMVAMFAFLIGQMLWLQLTGRLKS